MAGNRTGGLKAAQRNLEKDPNYYKNIGAKSWKNPDRSRETGFALNPELAKVAGAKGGKKTKNDYKTTLSPEVQSAGKNDLYLEEYVTAEEIASIFAEVKADSSGPL